MWFENREDVTLSGDVEDESDLEAARARDVVSGTARTVKDVVVPTAETAVPGSRWKQVTAEHVAAAAVAEPRSTPPIRISRERFQIEEELGRGGMGVVVAATDTTLARRVAIKQALTHRAEDMQRFEREIRITARLEHPSIVPIYDAGRDERGQPYYVMRRIEGEPLSDRVARTGSLSHRLALVPNVVAAADAVAFAHARGIIHRDLKPHNILLGAHGETSVIDWGLARELGDSSDPLDSRAPTSATLTQVGQVYGTLGFMPPEQARAEPVDARADVYALGATLYFVLSGELPMSSDLAGSLEPLGDALPGELRTIIAKATAPRREDRYADARALAEDLHSFLTGRLVSVHRYSRRERVRRFVRRHRVALALAISAVIALGSLGALAFQRTSHDRDLANVARTDAEARERIASENAETALLDHASTLASRDPTRAAALLVQLPRDSHQLARARDIAASAASAGIAHGIRPHDGWVIALALSPDGTQLASSGADGTLQVHELVTRRSKIVFRGEPVRQIVWGATGAVAFTSGTSLHVFDTSAGVELALRPELRVRAIWCNEGCDRLRYFDEGRRVIAERGFVDHEETILASDVEDVRAGGDVLAIKRGGRFELQTNSKNTSTPLPATWNYLQISPDGTRVAAIAGTTEVVEVEIATGAQRRWSVLDVSVLVYGPDDLYALQAGWASSLVRLGGRGVIPIATVGGGRILLSKVAGQLAVAVEGGGLWLIGRGSTHQLPFPTRNALAIAGRDDRSILAVATADGEVLWWNLHDMIPPNLPAPLGPLCGFDARSIVVSTNTGLTVIDRATGGASTIDTEELFGKRCHGLAGELVILEDGAKRRTLFDLKTKSVDARLGQVIAYDPEAAVVVGVDEHGTVRERVGTQAVERWRGATPEALYVKGDWIVVQTADRVLTRIDRRTNERVVWLDHPRVDDVAVAEDGVIWTITKELAIYRSEPTTVVRHGDSPVAARLLHAFADRLVIHGRDLSLASYADGKRTMIAMATNSRYVGFTGRIAYWVEASRHLTTLYLDTNEAHTTVAAVQWIAGHLGELAIHDGKFVSIVRDLVPQDPTKLHAWLAGATNAELDRGGRLEWRTP